MTLKYCNHLGGQLSTTYNYEFLGEAQSKCNIMSRCIGVYDSTYNGAVFKRYSLCDISGEIFTPYVLSDPWILGASVYKKIGKLTLQTNQFPSYLPLL